MTEQPLTNDAYHVNIYRAGEIESQHLVDIAVCDAKGEIILRRGAYNRLVFPRSAMKPLQAIALIETLIETSHIDRLSQGDISVICASHNGASEHSAQVSELLAKFELQPDQLMCGAHWSLNQAALIDQVRTHEQPAKIHNNCSGKHAGMLILAQILGISPDNYHHPDHPVQQKINAVLNEMTGQQLDRMAIGVDGCGAPAPTGYLHHWATGFARFANPTDLSPLRQEAVRRIAEAIAAAPLLIAGHGRACSAVNAAYGQDVTVKIGAEGVYAASFHATGLGLMLKARDGHMRAAEVALGAVISYLGFEMKPACAPFFQPELKNWAGTQTGYIAGDRLV